jgi:microsomal epoxide hydrolase
MESQTLSEVERQGLQRRAEFMNTGRAYALEHATRTSTIGHVLASNPIALLAW